MAGFTENHTLQHRKGFRDYIVHPNIAGQETEVIGIFQTYSQVVAEPKLELASSSYYIKAYQVCNHKAAYSVLYIYYCATL